MLVVASQIGLPVPGSLISILLPRCRTIIIVNMRGEWSIVKIQDWRVDVFEPPVPAEISFGILFLHDMDGSTLCDHPVFGEVLAQRNLACLCPSGGQSWWTDRVSAEFERPQTAESFLLDFVLPEFASRWKLTTPRIGLLGIGMGGQGALKLAFKYPERFPAVAALSPALDYHEWYGQGTPLDEMYDSKEQCRQDTALLHVHPSRYPPHIFFAVNPDDSARYRGNDRLHEKLGALGISHEFESRSAVGGDLASYDKLTHRAIGFLMAGLEHESRRLL
jgi:S-formylglutathione hydrolase FrmB